jgi:hypothetical protein
MRCSQLKVGQKVIVVYPNSNVIHGVVESWFRTTSYESVCLQLPRYGKVSYVDSALIHQDTLCNRFRIFAAKLCQKFSEHLEAKRYKYLHDIQ